MPFEDADSRPTGEKLDRDASPSLRSYRSVRRFAIVVAVILAAYAGLFIYRSSFVVEGKRYFCLFDDAMISMRYAANWAAGHGLVWNVGERVEGYTNFLWTLAMAGCHLLPLSGTYLCLLIQLLGVVVLLACVAATVLLARACRITPIAACCALLLAATQWNLNFLTLMGMETGLLTLVVTLALRSCVLAIQREEGRAAPALWFAIALLIRPDALITFAFAILVVLLYARRCRWRVFLGLAIAGVVAGAHLLWRHHYYGSWVPNTYYLKATGWPLADRIVVGLRTSSWTVRALGLPMLLALAAVIRPRRWQILLGGAFLLDLAYQTYMGGDAWQTLYRFVVPTTIGLMIMAGHGIDQLSRLLKDRVMRGRLRMALTALAIIAVNSLYWSHWLLQMPPPGTRANRSSVCYALAAERVAEPGATTAVTWAGAFPYFWGGKCFDMMGKCDPYIAHLPARPELPLAGHNKFDPEYTITTSRPDLVVDGLRIVPPLFFERYHPIRFDVDGQPLMLSVRNGSNRVFGGEEVSWDDAKEIYLQTPRD
jgi:arabinofuranosyltransferase